MTGMTTVNFATFATQQKINVTEKLKVTSTTSGTTLATGTNALSMLAGRIYIVMLAWDPSGASVPTVTLSDTANTYTSLAALYPAPATTSAGGGVITQAFITTAGADANRTLTATFSAAITAKAMTIIELTGATTTQRNVATTNRGTTWTNYNSPSGNQYDIILTMVGQETNIAGQPTSGSTSTSNGNWRAISNNFTSGGSAVTNIGISYQYKLLTGSGAQSNAWTLGSSNNWGSQSFVLQAA